MNGEVKPIRVQLSRKKGWRMPPDTVKVARPGKWGNKFRIGDIVEHIAPPNIIEMIHVRTARDAVDLYADWIEMHLRQHPEIMRPALDELRGKNLACWCPLSEPCHADVLLQIANAPDVWRCPDCGNEARFNHRGCHIFADAP